MKQILLGALEQYPLRGSRRPRLTRMKQILLAFALTASLAAPAAADYKCQDNRVEKGGSTQFTICRAGAEYHHREGRQHQGQGRPARQQALGRRQHQDLRRE
jgi:hypothetical protein